MISRFLCVLVLCAAGAGARPNIVYINADDLGVMDVAYNSERYQTPNIYRLARAGMMFSEAYAAAANCAPSRACVFSGRTTSRHGVYTVGNSDRGNAKHRKLIPAPNTEHLADEILTLAEALKAGGYKTIHLGKWHLGADPTTQGFDVNIGGDTAGGPNGGYFTPFSKGSMVRYNAAYKKGTFRGDILVDEALRFMKENKGEPMFVHVAWFAIHSKLEPVPEYIKKYRGRSDVDPVYASMVEKMDSCVGRLLKGLDKLGLADDTLVVFSSDNGGIRAQSSQEPYRAGKGSYFEGGIRVPLAIRWPGVVAPKSTCRVPVTGLDFYPTFLAAAGLPVPDGKTLDGESLLPLLTKQGAFPERTLFWHFPIYLQQYEGWNDDARDPLFRTRPGTIARKGNWKLHEYFEDGALELYDLRGDPSERINLAGIHAKTTAEMHREMKAWRAAVNAPIPTEPNPEYDAAAEAEAIANMKK